MALSCHENLKEMFKIRVQTLGEYKNIIEITSNMFYIPNGVMHHSRKGCKTVLLLKEYHLKFKHPKITGEVCFLYLFFERKHLPVSRKEIEVAKVQTSSQFVKYFFDHGK